MTDALARCIAEQRKCADYLSGLVDDEIAALHGTQDASGAMRGLEDWLMELF